MTDTEKVKCEYSGTVDSNFTLLELDAEKIRLLLHNIQEDYFSYEVSNKSMQGTEEEHFRALQFLEGWKEMNLYLDMIQDYVNESTEYVGTLKGVLGYE